jgi:hypothetical protein
MRRPGGSIAFICVERISTLAGEVRGGSLAAAIPGASRAFRTAMRSLGGPLVPIVFEHISNLLAQGLGGRRFLANGKAQSAPTAAQNVDAIARQNYSRWQVAAVQNIALGEHARSAYDISQFGDISWPRISDQNSLGAKRHPPDSFPILSAVLS